ncbi:hypothetical protein DFAR_2960007 [Desulfarculales bacterium]
MTLEEHATLVLSRWASNHSTARLERFNSIIL